MPLVVGYKDQNITLDTPIFSQITGTDHFGDCLRTTREIRNSPDSVLLDTFINAGILGIADLKADFPTPRLGSLHAILVEAVKRAVSNFEPTIKKYSENFVETAINLSKSGILPIKASEIQRRFRRLSFHLFDPIAKGSNEPYFKSRNFSIGFPLPLSSETISYSDFVHECLHGISGRTVSALSWFQTGRPEKKLEISVQVSRVGLSFSFFSEEKGRFKRFDWLSEGLCETLVPFFGVHTHDGHVSYKNQSAITRSLIDPNGPYKVPTHLLAAAFFADFTANLPFGIRFPEWFDLTRVLPSNQLLKIEAMIEKYGVEIAAAIVEKKNVFELSLKDIGKFVVED